MWHKFVFEKEPFWSLRLTNDKKNFTLFFQVGQLIFHIQECTHFRRTLSDYTALSVATQQFGDQLDKMDKCRLVLQKNIETEEERKQVLDEYLAAERRRLEQRNRDATSNLLRIPIICTLPSCSSEENVSIRGLEPFELPIRTVVTNEKRPLASRHETDAIKLRAMFLDGVPLAIGNTEVRKKRTIPNLIAMAPTRVESTPGQGIRSSVIQHPVPPAPVPRESPTQPTASSQLQSLLSNPPRAFAVTSPTIIQNSGQIVSGTMQVPMDNVNNLPILVSYRIPVGSSPGSLQQNPVIRPSEQLIQHRTIPTDTLTVQAPSAPSPDTGLRITNVVSYPEAPTQTAQILIPTIPNTNTAAQGQHGTGKSFKQSKLIFDRNTFLSKFITNFPIVTDFR